MAPSACDKVAKIRNHLYHAIDHCGVNGTELRRIIDSCVPHFQDNHENCSADSECKAQDYVPNFNKLTDSSAVKLLTDFLNTLTLYNKSCRMTA